jgi:hypothetical protein
MSQNNSKSFKSFDKFIKKRINEKLQITKKLNDLDFNHKFEKITQSLKAETLPVENERLNKQVAILIEENKYLNNRLDWLL